MKKHINIIQAIAIAGLLSTVALLSCQKTDYPDAQPSTSGVTSTSALVVNASNATGIMALFQNTAVGSTLAPGTYTPYSLISVGSAQVRVKGSGGTLGTNDLSSQLTFLPNTSYSIFVTDTITRPRVVNATGSVTDAGGVRFLQVVDPPTLPAAGSTGVRFLNLAPDAPALSLRLQPTPPTSATVAPTFSSRGYRVTSVTSGTVTTFFANFTPVAAGTYRADAFSSSSTTTPVASTTLNLESTKIYTLFTQGLVKNKTITIAQVKNN